jgi:hypothetical protein
MVDEHDPITHPSSSLTPLRFAIHSARAVVEALIARDRDAAEKAALRTCRDCDLLIHLIRDLILVLRDPCNEQLGLRPLESAILMRRAEQVLALVEEQEAGDLPPAWPSHLTDATSRVGQLQGKSFAKWAQDGASTLSPLVSQGLTVASTGLRVRLTAVDTSDSGSPTGEDRENDRSGAAPSKPGSRLDER